MTKQVIDLEHINITVKCEHCGFEYVTSDDKETMPCPKCGEEVKVNFKH